MNNLPKDKFLNIQPLISSLNYTSASYKYYWLIAIIQVVEAGKVIISKKELFSRMVSSAWYTVNYYRISFGKQDKLQRAIENIKLFENLSVDEDQQSIVNCLISSSNRNTNAQLNYFNNQVPHWFLTPWFPKANKTEIYNYSKDFNNQCPYALCKEVIEINPSWVYYFLENAALIKSFCYWNLVNYLQSKNPNVPNIPSKVIKPAKRNNLSDQRKNFWDIVIGEKRYFKCIYTGNLLSIGNYDVEHFIPHNFVSHDLIWNLIPADKTFNIAKSDKLPIMDKYFPSYFNHHISAIKIIIDKQPRNKYLEEYLTIFPDINKIESLNTDISLSMFKDKILPLITIAHNNGFSFM